jgi:hypothetical protein
MNSPLKPVPLTPEDRDIWIYVGYGKTWVFSEDLESNSAFIDRRDAELMFYISAMSEKHYHPDLPAECWLPMAHVYLKIDPEWPAGHNTIDMT